jgi:hypothetical protein
MSHSLNFLNIIAEDTGSCKGKFQCIKLRLKTIFISFCLTLMDVIIML